MAKILVVIGGGAAGFFCAVNAARQNPQLRVVILEKTGKLLSKVKVSGGGRCNVTHSCFDIPELVQRYPRGQHFLKKALHWFGPSDTISWFAERGVKLKAEADGRMFPITDSAQTIIDCLLKEADTYKVEIKLNHEVTGITQNGDAFELSLGGDKPAVKADFLCIACGGYPKTAQFNWLLQSGHHIEPPVPSLFTFNMPGNPITSLMGVSVPMAQVKVTGTKMVQEGPLLITHWGMSGPVILRTSAWGARLLAEKDYRFSIQVNWLYPEYANEQSLRNAWPDLRSRLAGQALGNKNPFQLPARLWAYLLQQAGIQEQTRWGDLAAKLQNRLIQLLTTQSFDIHGKTTFKEEFVTCGGIQLSEIEANTMQSRLVPNLFFAGEIMDVDGVTGGFNFQHAWCSGWVAAKAIAEKQG
ncbi:BaiN/RdsA family NAD(P)/FAD-dependent oxidoreductase [Filimonas effusa]|uniref:NAD(P)/FAD-dependent oxidoreductase n=1 Tax=Filimonas effusa TaxID=2508721 RepID=A0A4Q1D0U6_9BACT|nr:NAD(P)/FAD-dependent oxidoreductase [Filimonas effusa]RXK81383.1 NAD(P)/FAD-dependent oxidoreductase [Filimonas effusa]